MTDFAKLDANAGAADQQATDTIGQDQVDFKEQRAADDDGAGKDEAAAEAEAAAKAAFITDNVFFRTVMCMGMKPGSELDKGLDKNRWFYDHPSFGHWLSAREPTRVSIEESDDGKYHLFTIEVARSEVFDLRYSTPEQRAELNGGKDDYILLSARTVGDLYQKPLLQQFDVVKGRIDGPSKPSEGVDDDVHVQIYIASNDRKYEPKYIGKFEVENLKKYYNECFDKNV